MAIRESRICAVPGCDNPRAGSSNYVCFVHIHEDIGRQVQLEARRHDAEIQFRRRRELGEYTALFDDPLRAILADAGEELTMTDELGAVRYALAKLLSEEEDPRQLASGVARLVSAAATLVRTRVATAPPEQPAVADGIESLMHIGEALGWKRDKPARASLPAADEPALPAGAANPLDLPDEDWPMQERHRELIPASDKPRSPGMNSRAHQNKSDESDSLQ